MSGGSQCKDSARTRPANKMVRREVIEFNLVIPSSVIEDVTFDLKEGENKFTVEVDSLNETDTYYLTVVRDTIPPVISIEERVQPNNLTSQNKGRRRRL